MPVLAESMGLPSPLAARPSPKSPQNSPKVASRICLDQALAASAIIWNTGAMASSLETTRISQF